ncbi:MAG: hypothetical protein FWH08_06725 [Oscillospiraceae bacterium]|nr:hypothetical protein [Oscillospiraceae bacterium]
MSLKVQNNATQSHHNHTVKNAAQKQPPKDSAGKLPRTDKFETTSNENVKLVTLSDKISIAQRENVRPLNVSEPLPQNTSSASSFATSAQSDPMGTVYGKYGTSNLLNINDDEHRNAYYRSLFESNADTINGVFDSKRESGGSWSPDWIATADNSITRYQELREQIINTFGDNEELLSKNLDSLDKAFELTLVKVARSTASQLEFEREYAKNETGTSNHKWESNKLATNKNFNEKVFETHAVDMMKQFAQSFLKQVNGGFNFGDALKNATDFMNNAFGKTTSVNNLSFSDFMLLQTPNYGDADLSTKAGNIIARNNNNNWFNSNPGLSAELRAMLDEG